MNASYSHYGRLRAFVARLLPSHLRRLIDEEDLIQETYVSAWQHDSKIRDLDSSEEHSWLRTVARRKLIDQIRRKETKKRDGGLECRDGRLPDEAQSPTRTPSSLVAKQEAADVVAAALAQLSERHRQVIQLRYFEGRSFPEIADAMHISSEASQMLLQRAVAKLRKLIGSESHFFA